MMKLKHLLFTILALLVMGGQARAVTYTICALGCDYTEVESCLIGEVIQPNDHIRLDGDVTEPDTCTWNGDSGTSGNPIILDLNGHTWDMTVVAGVMVDISSDYITIQGPGTISGTGIVGETISHTGGTGLTLTNFTLNYNAFLVWHRGVFFESATEGIVERLLINSLDSNQGHAVEIRNNCDDIVVRNCIAKDPNNGFYVHDTDGVDYPTNIKIYDNAVYKYNTYGIYISTGVKASEVTLKNNIFYGNGSSPCTGVYDDDVSSSATLDYNDYYNNTTDVAGTSSKGAHAVTADPLFVDAANDDFHLQIDSPCIDAGVYAGQVSDLDGWPMLGLAWNIGPYEERIYYPQHVPKGLNISSIGRGPIGMGGRDRCRQ